MTAEPEFCDTCPHCIGELARTRIGEPCVVCGKELTDVTYSTQQPGVCAWCLATWKPPSTRLGATVGDVGGVRAVTDPENTP